MGKRQLLAALAALGCLLVAAPAVSAAPATFSRVSADGSLTLFTTTDQLVASDTDTRTDVYARMGTTTSLVSANLPAAGNGPFNAFFAGASADASHVFISTAERLTAADTDTSVDVYERFGGQMTLVSTGPSGGDGPYAADLRAVSTDGQRIIFTTDESLSPTDTDTSADIYERAGGVTTLISTNASGGNGAADVQFRAASTDATRVFFVTDDRLAAGDTDNAVDAYEHSAGITNLISTGPAGGNAEIDVSFGASSADGAAVYLETNEALVGADTDAIQDVYRRFGGTITLVSTGPTGGNGNFDASLQGISADGSHAYFRTAEALVAGDTDGSADLYDGAGAPATLVSTGPAGGNGGQVAQFSGASFDGSQVLFTTSEPLVPTDSDSSVDIYRRAAASTTLISVGDTGQNGAGDVSFDDVSTDGSRVSFSSLDALTADDGDTSRDVFTRSGSSTTLVSANLPFAGNGPNDAGFVGATPSGSHIFFETREHLTSDDTDSATDADVFARSGVTTLLISGGGAVSTSPDPPELDRTDPASPSADNNPHVIGTAPAFYTVGIYSTPDCSGPPLATGRGATFSSPGIQVAVPPDSVTVFRATVTDDANNTSPCSSDFLTYLEQSTVVSPQLTGTTPASPAPDTHPAVMGSAPAGATVKLYLGANCSGQAAAAGTASQLGGGGISVTVPATATTPISATATDSLGNVSACSDPITYVESSTPVTPPVDTTPPGPPRLASTNPSSPSSSNTFNVRGVAAVGSLVRLYRGPTCSGAAIATGSAAQLGAGGLPVTVADDSVTEIHATATDAAGNRSSCSGPPITYVEDSTAPRARITYGPAFKTRRRNIAFRFADRTEDPTARFICRIDRRRYRRCSTPQRFRRLAGRRHVLRVKAVDAAGNRQAGVTMRRFMIVRGHR